MTEIKFKVYDKEEKCFHYFTLANILQYRKEFEKHIINGDKFDLFTGLHDKNGKEIYEGDICKHGDDIACIDFWEGSFIFNKYYMHAFSLTNFACCKTFEIIGSIHENPELIK